ncbi:MAG: c-type cytochrome [Nitrospira sp.]|nr:c-type cytochrome [Nitrospira sp.]MBS0168171.1 c-type cytochrome [Nitrospira sp.]
MPELVVRIEEGTHMKITNLWRTLLIAGIVVWPLIGDATDRKTPTAPEEFLKMANPVTPTAEMLKEAATIYDSRCSKCHGSGGNGKGSATKDLDVKPRDYTDKSLMRTIPDGQLLWVIANGSDPDTTEMKGYKKKLSEEQMWSLVHYIRAFAQ